MAILAMTEHGQDARATAQLTLKGSAQKRLEEVVQVVAPRSSAASLPKAAGLAGADGGF